MDKSTLNIIKVCPFCGTNHSLVSCESFGEFSVECDECGASGPVADNDNHAWDLWQQRVEGKYTQYAGHLN